MIVSVEQLQKYTETLGEDNEMAYIYLSSAEDIINDYLGYNTLNQSYITIRDGYDKPIFLLDAKPVTNLEKVIINGVEQDLGDFICKDETIISINPDIVFTSDTHIEYTAGYEVLDPDVVLNPVPIYYPGLISMTVLRIAALLQTESGGNIGVTSKSFGSDGSRTFIQTLNFDKYLSQLNKYKLVR